MHRLPASADEIEIIIEPAQAGTGSRKHLCNPVQHRRVQGQGKRGGNPFRYGPPPEEASQKSGFVSEYNLPCYIL